MYAITYQPSGARRTSAEIVADLSKIGTKNIDTNPEVYREAFKHLCALERLGARSPRHAGEEIEILTAADSFVEKIARRGIQEGDTVRLYGYPGTFTAGPIVRPPFIFKVSAPRRGFTLEFNTPLSTVVEINGIPCPLQSCPLDMPAEDYPHAPTFDYDDGPKNYAKEILARWNRRREQQPAYA